MCSYISHLATEDIAAVKAIVRKGDSTNHGGIALEAAGHANPDGMACDLCRSHGFVPQMRRLLSDCRRGEPVRDRWRRRGAGWHEDGLWGQTKAGDANGSGAVIDTTGRGDKVILRGVHRRPEARQRFSLHARRTADSPYFERHACMRLRRAWMEGFRAADDARGP